VLLLGILTVIGTLVSDLLLMWIDPRITVDD
jgi:peptide/nickel transport system permease protein